MNIYNQLFKGKIAEDFFGRKFVWNLDYALAVAAAKKEITKTWTNNSELLTAAYGKERVKDKKSYCSTRIIANNPLRFDVVT